MKQYDCISSPLERNGISYAWWSDRNGNSQYFWSGSNSRIHVCQCGIEQTCFENDVKCNCDSDAKLPLADQGINENNQMNLVKRRKLCKYFGLPRCNNQEGIVTSDTFEFREDPASQLHWYPHTRKIGV